MQICPVLNFTARERQKGEGEEGALPNAPPIENFVEFRDKQVPNIPVTDAVKLVWCPIGALYQVLMIGKHSNIISSAVLHSAAINVFYRIGTIWHLANFGKLARLEYFKGVQQLNLP